MYVRFMWRGVACFDDWYAEKVSPNRLGYVWGLRLGPIAIDCWRFGESKEKK